MKTIRYTISTFLFAFSSLAAHSEGNPAAIYCEHMGYQYEVETDENGGEKGVCILPDGSKVNAWDFYLGKIKPEYSYCKKNSKGKKIFFFVDAILFSIRLLYLNHLIFSLNILLLFS